MNKLRFTPYAWAKLIFLRDIGNTEVSFYALTRKDDISLVTDVLMVPQRCSGAYTEFKDDGIADFFDKMVDDGYEIENFARIWCHTHPGSSATPSTRDHTTFADAFGSCHWAIMFILGTTGETTCKLKYRMNPISPKFPGQDIVKEIPVVVRLPLAGMDTVLELSSKDACDKVDWKVGLAETNKELWTNEYKENWEAITYSSHTPTKNWNNQADYDEFIRSPSSWVPGPGWRVSSKGHWCLTEEQKQKDLLAGITVSPDYKPPKKVDFGPTHPATANNGMLTKRERKYLKKNGSLAGFIPPTNPGTKRIITPSSLVKIEKLETDRNLLTQQHDNNFDWMDDALEQAKRTQAHPDPIGPIPEEDDELMNYTITIDKAEYIPEKWRGVSFRNVMAGDPVEAMQKVHAKLGIAPFRGKINHSDGTIIYVPAPEDILDADDDTDIEETSPEQEVLENKLLDIYALEDKGEITAEERKDQEDELWDEYEEDLKKKFAKEREMKEDELTLLPLDSLDSSEGLLNYSKHETQSNSIGFHQSQLQNPDLGGIIPPEYRLN